MRWPVVAIALVGCSNGGSGHEGKETGAPPGDSGAPSVETGDTSPGDSAPIGDSGGETAETGDTAEVAAVPELGTDHGRHLVDVATAADGLARPRDLDFDPVDGTLWVVNEDDDGMSIVTGAGTASPSIENRHDVYGDHFMEKVSSIGFSDGVDFATCQESENTYDDTSPPNDFMGPTLWDATIYALVHQHDGLLGSHIDMLHESPDCMGIAWDHDNAYWAFDGFHGKLVYYDFQEDHGAGGDDHSDGIVRMYGDVDLTRLPEVPGHIALDPATGLLYIADTGTGRVLRVDPSTGVVTGTLRETMEPLEEYSLVVGATVDVLVEGLVEPSGLALGDGVLFVTDHASGDIVAYDLSGTELQRASTGAAGIMGIALGPDGKLYYTDGDGDRVVRLDP